MMHLKNLGEEQWLIVLIFLTSRSVSEEVLLYEREHFYCMPNRHMLNWMSEQKNIFPHVTMLSCCVLAISGSKTEKEKMFSAAGVISKNRKNCIRLQNMDTIMNTYRNYGNNVLPDYSGPILQNADIGLFYS